MQKKLLHLPPSSFKKYDGGSSSASVPGSDYVLPIATANVLGGVKAGAGVTISETGVISAEGGGSAPDLAPYALEVDLLALEDLPNTPVLTGLSNVAVAFGLVRQVPGATRCIRLRRSSDDVEQDFYFDTKGALNLSDIFKFLNGFRGYVPQWYNQAGDFSHFLQPVKSLQPYFAVDRGVPKVRFENSGNGIIGQALVYTLATPVNVNNTTVFCAYSSYLSSGTDSVYPVANFSKRYFLSSLGSKLDLCIDGLNASKPDSLSLNGVSTATLFAGCQNNYFSISSNGTATKVRSRFVEASIAGLASATETQFKLGNFFAGDSNPFAGDVFSYIQFSAVQPDTVIDAISTGLDSSFDLISLVDSPNNLVFSGDSLGVIGSTDNFNYPRLMNATAKTPVLNFCRSSNTYVIQNSNNYNVALDSTIIPGKNNILFYFGGTNDLQGATAAPLAPAVVKAAAVAFATARFAAGWSKVVMFTALDRGSVGTFTTYNNLMLADTVSFSAVLPVAADKHLQFLPGVGGNTSALSRPDMAYSYDLVHLTSLGSAVIASYCDNYIESVSNVYVTASLGRRINKLEAYINDLVSKDAANGKGFRYNAKIAIDGTLYTTRISSSQKALTDLEIQANDTDLLTNSGSIFMRPNGGGRMWFGIKRTDPIVTGGDANATYTFGGAYANSLYMDMYNPAGTDPRTYIRFLNDGTQTNITNSRVGSSAPYHLDTYSLYDTTIESGQTKVYLKAMTVAGLTVAGKYYDPAAGGSGYQAFVGIGTELKNPQAFLHLAASIPEGVSMIINKGGAPTVLVDGAIWYDSTGLHFRKGGVTVNLA